jgi:putative phage-type endonuclease
MTREDWLQHRRAGIGGSDAGSIAGLNPWRTPLDVYLDKTGEIPPVEENELMYWGTVLEDVVAQEFSKRTSLKIRRNNSILKNEQYPFMLANVDRMIVGVKDGLECKTANAFMKEKWSDGGIPDAYQAQVQHYMAVTGFDAWWIAVLIGGNDFRYQKVKRDDEFIDLLIKLEKDFWENNILAGVMPEIDGSKAANELVKKMFPSASTGAKKELSKEANSNLSLYLEYEEMEKKYKLLKDEMGNKIKLELEDTEIGMLPNHIVSWKNVSSNRFDSKGFQKDHPDLFKEYSKISKTRRFTIKKNK